VNVRNNSYNSTIIQLCRNALYFRYHRLKSDPLKPKVVSLALTNRCNSHCIMCNIWKGKRELPDIKAREMSTREIIELLSRPLFSQLVELDLTGGEPHLRNNLVETVIGVARLKKSSLPKLRSIVITSNGLLPEKIITNYQRILEGLRDIKVDLVSVSSLDGIGEVHDKIRGTSNAFEQVSKTIDGLLHLRSKYANFFPGIKTTILPSNVDKLDGILDFALIRNMFHIISPVFFTEARFRNMDQKDNLVLRDADYQKILEFYRRNKLNTGYYYYQACNSITAGQKRWVWTA
jgi:MoaA/NifB/PqqE/SkfB family radical SAM enzyme